MPTERRLAAIMFTDIVGYTALMAESEERGLRARERHRELVRPLVAKYHGESIEARGDESLSTFPTALDAVNCALAIGDQLQSDAALKLHIGIHLGDVVVQDGEVSGDGVNIAARICALSRGDAPYISDEVQHTVQNQANLSFESLGEHEFKNVPRPVPIYRVTGAAQPPRRIALLQRLGIRHPRRWLAAAAVLLALVGFGVWSRYRPVELAPIRSIAVLPLENLSGDPEQEYFADGMTDALIGELAKLGSLLVISRTSVMRYKQSDKSLPEIARELGVEGIIEGTVVREEDQVRITAQLIDARNDQHLWSQSYDRELSELLALQRDVALAVARQLRLELAAAEFAALTEARRSVDPRAYDALLQAVEILFQGLTPTSARRALEHLERAIQIDPSYAEAHAGMAGFYVGLGELSQARQAAQKALELDDSLAIAHTFMGFVQSGQEWDFDGARRSHERAMQLSPSDGAVLNGYAWHLMYVGRIEEALAVSERMVRVGPYQLTDRANHLRRLFLARQYERFFVELERMRELDPGFQDTFIGWTYFEMGRLEEAHRASIAFGEFCGTPCDWWREAFERGWAQGGFEGSIREYIGAAMDRMGHPAASPALIAAHYAMIGETNEAFLWLERAYSERDSWTWPLLHLKVNPLFDPLRSDPRFDDLLRRIGFPESD